ncbi:hypothetical protein KJ865_12305, partial [Myxococcota bacterium]|nr:hypothetical protein [Myxococcota bacterium]
DPMAPLTPIPYTAPDFGVPPDSASTRDLLEVHATLLEELGYRESNMHWLMEAARLNLALGDRKKAGNLLYAIDPKEDHGLACERALLSFSVAFQERSSLDAREQALFLANEGVCAAASLLAELNVLLDEPLNDPPFPTCQPLWDQARVDRIASQRDTESLEKALDSLPYTDTPMKILQARLLEESNPEKAIEIYLHCLDSTLAEYAHFRLIHAGNKLGRLELVNRSLRALHEQTPLPWIELEMILMGQLPERHCNHPLVLWVAAQKGLVPYSSVARRVVSRKLAARFIMTHLSLTEDPIDGDAVMLDPESYEWEALWKLRCAQLDPRERLEMLYSWSDSVDDQVMAWWLDRSVENPGKEILPLVILDEISTNPDVFTHDSQSISHLPASIRTAALRLLILRGHEIPHSDRRLTVSSLRAHAGFKRDAQRLVLYAEEELAVEGTDSVNLLLELISRGSKGSYFPSIAHTYFRELEGQYVSCWEELLLQMSPEESALLAHRAAIKEEFFARNQTETFIDLAPAKAGDRLRYRWARRFGTLDEIDEAFHKLQNEGAEAEFLGAVSRWLAGKASPKHFSHIDTGESRPLLAALMEKLGLYEELASMWQQDLRKVESPHEKVGLYQSLAHVYEQLIPHQQKALTQRSALRKADPENSYNLLKIIEFYAASADFKRVSETFTSLHSVQKGPNDQHKMRMELWRQAYILRHTLPPPRDLSLLLEWEHDPYLLYWNFMAAKGSDQFAHLESIRGADHPDTRYFYGEYIRHLYSEGKPVQAQDALKALDFSMDGYRASALWALLVSAKEKDGDLFRNASGSLSKHAHDLLDLLIGPVSDEDLMELHGIALEIWKQDLDGAAKDYLELYRTDKERGFAAG